jgi:hypothetical protein
VRDDGEKAGRWVILVRFRFAPLGYYLQASFNAIRTLPRALTKEIKVGQSKKHARQLIF